MSMLLDALHAIGAVKAGWTVAEPHMGEESLLSCPEGCVIEQDGACPHGESPLRAAGLI